MQKHAKGQELLTKVCDHVNLLEKDYFGLANWETPNNKVGWFFCSCAFSFSAGALADILHDGKLVMSSRCFVFPRFPQTWLEATKEIRKQVSGAVYEFTFSVKFYPPDPAQLTEDLTR